MIILSMVAALAIQATPAPTSEQTAADTRAERQVCRREVGVGSNRPTRICKTAREWAAQREADSRYQEQSIGAKGDLAWGQRWRQRDDPATND